VYKKAVWRRGGSGEREEDNRRREAEEGGGYPVVSAPFVEKNSFPNEWSWHPCEKNQLIINIWVYFWPLNSISLVYMSILMLVPHRLDYCSAE